MRLRRERLGPLNPSSPPGRERKLKKAGEVEICMVVFDKPDATLEELVDLVAKRLRVRVSISTMSRRTGATTSPSRQRSPSMGSSRL
jgi:transposase